VRALPQYDQLVYWAAHEWQRRYPDQPYVAVWSETECSNKLALQRVKVGRKLKGSAIYRGYGLAFCPYIMPINKYYTVGRREIFSECAGAYVFTFDSKSGPFDVLYAASYREEAW